MSKRGSGEGSIFFDPKRGHWVGKLPRDESGRRQRVIGRTDEKRRNNSARRTGNVNLVLASPFGHNAWCVLTAMD